MMFYTMKLMEYIAKKQEEAKEVEAMKAAESREKNEENPIDERPLEELEEDISNGNNCSVDQQRGVSDRVLCGSVHHDEQEPAGADGSSKQ